MSSIMPLYIAPIKTQLFELISQFELPNRTLFISPSLSELITIIEDDSVFKSLGCDILPRGRIFRKKASLTPSSVLIITTTHHLEIEATCTFIHDLVNHSRETKSHYQLHKIRLAFVPRYLSSHLLHLERHAIYKYVHPEITTLNIPALPTALPGLWRTVCRTGPVQWLTEIGDPRKEQEIRELLIDIQRNSSRFPVVISCGRRLAMPLCQHLARMDAPPPSSPPRPCPFGALVVMSREVDTVSPLLHQRTHLGLLDERVNVWAKIRPGPVTTALVGCLAGVETREKLKEMAEKLGKDHRDVVLHEDLAQESLGWLRPKQPMLEGLIAEDALITGTWPRERILKQQPGQERLRLAAIGTLQLIEEAERRKVALEMDTMLTRDHRLLAPTAWLDAAGMILPISQVPKSSGTSRALLSGGRIEHPSERALMSVLSALVTDQLPPGRAWRHAKYDAQRPVMLVMLGGVTFDEYSAFRRSAHMLGITLCVLATDVLSSKRVICRSTAETVCDPSLAEDLLEGVSEQLEELEM